MNLRTAFHVVAALIFSGILSNATAQNAQTPPRLNIGDDAPALKVDRWYKGSPVTAFEPGRIYVVEFWATWCAPCKEAMPHLSVLARKYKEKVTITGVSVAENGTGIPAKIEKFVAGMGNDMDYPVAGDAGDGHMYKNWVQAVGENSIPVSIVVDGKGKIAWIGTPGGLEKPIEQLIAGTFDPKAAIKERADARSGITAYRAAESRINRAIAAKDIDGAYTAIRGELAKPSELNYMLMLTTNEGLFRLDEIRAYTELKSLLQDPKYHDAVKQSAMMLVELDNLSPRSYELAVEEITRQIERTPSNAFGPHMLAMGYSRLGQPDVSIEWQEKAIELLKSDENATRADTADFAAKLEQYKTQAAKQ